MEHIIIFRVKHSVAKQVIQLHEFVALFLYIFRYVSKTMKRISTSVNLFISFTFAYFVQFTKKR